MSTARVFILGLAPAVAGAYCGGLLTRQIYQKLRPQIYHNPNNPSRRPILQAERYFRYGAIGVGVLLGFLVGREFGIFMVDTYNLVYHNPAIQATGLLQNILGH